MFITYLLGKFPHLRQAYSSDQEMVEHFLSGEVTIPFKDVLKYVDDYQKSFSSINKDKMKTIEIQGNLIHFDGEELIWEVGPNLCYHVRNQDDVKSVGLNNGGYLIDSNHKIGDEILFSVVQEYETNPYPLRGRVIGIHAYGNKTKYDLEIPVIDESPTRIYNIDSCFVLKA